MVIADVRWYVCDAGWRNWIFVEVETDTGLTGVGEATVEGRELTLLGHLEDIKRAVVGKDAADIAGVRRALTRDPFWSGGYVAGTGLAAIEVALWDILGKDLGVPVWQLFGGKLRDSVPAYANGWYFGATDVDDWVERAGSVIEAGYRALKFDPFGRADLNPDDSEVDQAITIVSELRTALGPQVQLLVEGHGRFSVTSAIRIAERLEPFDCMWLEEPIPPGNAEALRRVTEKSPVRIAAGERCFSTRDVLPLLTTGAVHVVQPDVIHVGGIAEAARIADLADVWGVAVAPHNPNGPVATAATLTVAAIAQNFLIQEILEPWDVAWRHEVVIGCPQVRDGRLEITDTPGIGVELDHAVLARHPFKPIDLAFHSETSVLEAVDLRSERERDVG